MNHMDTISIEKKKGTNHWSVLVLHVKILQLHETTDKAWQVRVCHVRDNFHVNSNLQLDLYTLLVCISYHV